MQCCDKYFSIPFQQPPYDLKCASSWSLQELNLFSLQYLFYKTISALKDCCFQEVTVLDTVHPERWDGCNDRLSPLFSLTLSFVLSFALFFFLSAQVSNSKFNTFTLQFLQLYCNGSHIQNISIHCLTFHSKIPISDVLACILTDSSYRPVLLCLHIYSKGLC